MVVDLEEKVYYMLWWVISGFYFFFWEREGGFKVTNWTLYKKPAFDLSRSYFLSVGLLRAKKVIMYNKKAPATTLPSSSLLKNMGGKFFCGFLGKKKTQGFSFFCLTKRLRYFLFFNFMWLCELARCKAWPIQVKNLPILGTGGVFGEKRHKKMFKHLCFYNASQPVPKKQSSVFFERKKEMVEE